MRIWTLFVILLINFVLLLTACSSEDKNAGGTSEAENSIAITDKDVAGVTQKGPFTKGSNVTLYELNFRTRAQTGKSFIGKISDSTGSFSINKIELASQYALLQAEGYYLNEITGKVSASQIALNAISDLSERDNVNINLLTHLEYERAVWLANENETTIKSAKVEADKEIFSAFGVEYDGDRFEDLDIFGNRDADAALLAISVIMHSGRTEGEFSLALANMAMDLEKDGKWDDTKAIAEAADNSFEADTVQIRKNMEDWNIAKTIPDFAPIVEYFWNDAFGLGRCTAKREGDTMPVSNSHSRYFEKEFVCENGHWYLASASDNCKGTTYDKSTQMCDSRDGNVYNIVTIGDGDKAQTWMSENLNYADSANTPSLKGKNFCFEDNEQNCTATGRLYTWAAAIDSIALYENNDNDCGSGKTCEIPEQIQGICPDGWHLPTQAEWNVLFDAVGGVTTAGKMLKSTTGWRGGANGVDAYKFSSFPGGDRTSGGFYGIQGDSADYWTASEKNSQNAYSIQLVDDSEEAKLWDFDKNYAFTVRCIQNSAP